MAALQTFSQLPRTRLGAGLTTEFGTLLPPGGQVVAIVDSNGVQEGDHASLQGRILGTLAAALKLCRAGKNDIIIVRPGHAENVTDATMLDNLVAGTQIIGTGFGTNMPTFTWTATAGQWTLDKADVRVSGLLFDMTGIDAVVKGIAITAAEVHVTGCDFYVALSDSFAALIALEVGAGGARANISGNRMRGVATAGITGGFVVAAAVAGVRICDNEMQASIAAATGLISVTAVAATELFISRNTIFNTETSSTACISFGSAANTGVVSYNDMATLNDGTASAQGVTFGASSLVRAIQNFSSDEPKLSGILAPAAAT